ncbi:MAG: hypothetical protein IJI66_03525 [Erysipelotrichaceae bacterium]|nr:hypothetical protein [Erysipelotrichaceae bacterium]
MQLYVFPRKESMQLTVILSPSACLDHQVRWFLSRSLIFRQLSQYRFILCKRRIADEEFNEERFIFACLCVLCRKGMPPPVITVMSQRPVQHEGIPGDIVMIKHEVFLQLPFRSVSFQPCSAYRKNVASQGLFSL